MTIAQRFEQKGLQQGGYDKAFEISKEMLAEGADFQFVNDFVLDCLNNRQR